jgi:hypothetical protein
LEGEVMATFNLLRIDKGDGSKDYVDNVDVAIKRIATHLGVSAHEVYSQLVDLGHIETDFNVYVVEN